MKNKTATYLIHLIRAVLQKEKPDEKPKDVSFEALYQLAKFHCVEGIVFYAIEQIEVKPEAALLKKWRANREGNIVKIMTQLAELESLSQLLSREEIRHTYLKGSVLVHDYPQVDYRYLGDVDLLIDAENAGKVYELLVNYGYQNKEFNLSNHDTYHLDKGSFEIIIEIHRQLFEEGEVYAPFFKNMTEKIFSLPNQSTYRYQMDLNDFYLFMIVHFAKHFYKGGGGIRSVMDVYVFLSKYKQELDWQLINEQIDALGLNEFHHQAVNLAEIWFGYAEAKEDLVEFGEAVITLGAFGSYHHFVSKKISDTYTKYKNPLIAMLSYILSRVFLPSRLMKKRYPLLVTYPFLLPFAWIYRLVKIALTKRHQIKYELKSLMSKMKSK